jgi:hypothetical protein
LLHQFNAHAEIAALIDGPITAQFGPRRTTGVRFARRIAMQVRRTQTRQLGR